jgi:serine/threonine-protein kinase HSL1 (negative regulator of Swe1 kinase)
MVESSWRTIGIMSPSSSSARVPSSRLPLHDTTAKVNNYQPTTTTRRTASEASSLHHLPHHESQAPTNNLQIRNNLEVRRPQAENKHLSALVSQDVKDMNRISQISTTSTNADGKSRRKTHVGPWHLGRTLGKGATGRVRFARHKLTSQPAAIKIVSKKAARSMQSRSIAAMDEVLAKTPAKEDGQRTIPSGIEREVIIMKLIEHPNIITLYDVWENRGE